MNHSFTFEVPASGGKVELVFPASHVGSPKVVTFDVLPPGGSFTMNFTPNALQKTSSNATPVAPPMLFSPLPLPYEEPPLVKYIPKPRTQVKPPTSSYVPLRFPSPEPDVQLEDPPPIPAELSDCGLVMYGYLVDDKFAAEMGLQNRYEAAFDISDCIDKLRIGAFVSMPSIPAGHELDIFYFALFRAGASICTVGNRGVPAQKLKELELKMNIKRPAEWIKYDDIHKWWE